MVQGLCSIVVCSLATVAVGCRSRQAAQELRGWRSGHGHGHTHTHTHTRILAECRVEKTQANIIGIR